MIPSPTLFVSNNITRPDTGGGRLAQRNLYLLQHTIGEHNVIIYRLDEKASPSIFRKYKIIRKIQTLLSSLCGFSNGLSPSRLIEILRLIKEKKTKILFLDSTSFGLITLLVRLIFRSVTIVSFAHNVEYDYVRQRAIFDGAVYRLLAVPTFLSEASAAKMSHTLLCLHGADATRFAQLYRTQKPETLPVSLSGHLKYKSKPTTDDYFLFVGSDFFANVEGIKWFCREVMPRSSFKLKIVGNGLDKYSEELSADNVTVHGFAADLAEFYRDAIAVICPVFLGSGMKVKTVEAISYAKFVIGTPHSFVGIETEPSWCRVCYSPTEFNSAMEERASYVRRAGSRYCESAAIFFDNNFSTAALVQKFDTIITRLG